MTIKEHIKEDWETVSALIDNIHTELLDETFQCIEDIARTSVMNQEHLDCFKRMHDHFHVMQAFENLRRFFPDLS